MITRLTAEFHAGLPKGHERRSNLVFPPEAHQVASLRSQRQKEGGHCEECNDEAISFSLGRPLSLLRSARKDRRGRHCEDLFCLVPAGSLFSGIGGLFCLSLRGAKRRSNLVSSPGPSQIVSLRSQRQKEGRHCEERSDEAISLFAPESP